MKTMKLRMLAVLTALMLMMGLVPALAESAPTAPDIASFFDSDQNIQMDIQVEINPMLGALVGTFTGAGGDEAQNEATQAALTTVVQAINKLKTTLIMSKNAVSGAIGTDKGVLIDFQALVDEAGNQSHITSSLLPDISLSLDPAMLAQLQAQTMQQQMTPEQAMQMVAPYLAVMTANFDKAKAGVTTEEGAFVTEGFGTYSKRTVLPVTTHMVADFVQDVLNVYKQDEQLKKLLESSMKNNPAAALAPMEGVSTPNPEEALQEMEKDLKRIKEEENKTVLLVNAYEDDLGGLYLDMVTPEGEDSAFKADLLLKGNPAELGSDLELSLRLIGRNATSVETPGEPVDWKVMAQELQSGQNYQDTLVNLSLSMKNELPKTKSDMSLDMIASGMRVGITANSASDLATKESSAVVGLSFMSPEPLVKLTFATKPVEEEPAQPLLEGKTNVMISGEDLSQDLQNKLNESLQSALPELINRLNIVLPEEATAFMALIQQSMGEDAPMPEPAPNP